MPKHDYNRYYLIGKNPSVKSDEYFLPTDFFYRPIIFTDELVFLFGPYFAFCCLKTP